MSINMFPATSMPDSDWWSVLWPNPKQVIQSLGVRAGMTVIDLCCGNGYFTIPIAQIVTPGKVYGVDLDRALLDEAKELAFKNNVAATWICCDARKLKGRVTEKVDFILIANTFHGVDDQVAFTQYLAHILKPEGKLAIINWHARLREETTVLNKPRGPATEMRLSPEKLNSVVEQAGMTQELLIQLPPYHYGAIFSTV